MKYALSLLILFVALYLLRKFLWEKPSCHDVQYEPVRVFKEGVDPFSQENRIEFYTSSKRSTPNNPL